MRLIALVPFLAFLHFGRPLSPSSNEETETWACDHVIVGAGWSSSYFAYRTTVDRYEDGTVILPGHTCFFEASYRIGGRAYSHPDIPHIQEGVRIDLGAYRWDTHAMPLSNHVFRDVLGAKTKCYDPGKCFLFSGDLRVVEGPHGNDGGYASGPEGLVKKFVEANGQEGVRTTFKYGYKLVNVLGSGLEDKPISLTFLKAEDHSVVTINTQLAFLGIPATAIRALNPNNLFQQDPFVRDLVDQPTQNPGAKQFLIYEDPVWRGWPLLREGLFSDDGDAPPMDGRFHDFYGICGEKKTAKKGVKTPDPELSLATCHEETVVDVSENPHKCRVGAVLTYYNFDLEAVKYYAQFQKNLSDPYVYLSYGEAPQMFDDLHERFCKALHKQDESFDCARAGLSKPVGTVISVWWARPELPETMLLPAPSYTGTRLKVTPSRPFEPTSYLSDPNHAIRNHMSKPFPNHKIFVANEAFSGGNGWAHPSLIMTERIIHRHLRSERPAWVKEQCHDCLTRKWDLGDCKDCVSPTWWEQEIEYKEDATQLIPEGEDGEHLAELRCLGPCGDPANLVHVQAHWTSTETVELTVKTGFGKSGWFGFGIGSSMFDADMVVVVVPEEEDGPCDHPIHFRRSYGHYEPQDPKGVVDAVGGSVTKEDGFITFKVTVPKKGIFRDSTLHFKDDQPTPIILAKYLGKLHPGACSLGGLKLNQHLAFQHSSVVVPRLVRFEEDVMPLFREKDRNAMLFMFDLWKKEDVIEFYDEIHGRIEAKTVYGLATGMPVDATWTKGQLRVLRNWKLGGFH